MQKHIIFGPPGTGKTTKLIDIVCDYINNGTPISKIAYVSFTRKATKEASDKFKERFNFDDESMKYFRTIHSLCYQMLNLTQDQVMSVERYRDFGKMLNLEFSKDFDDEFFHPGRLSGDKLSFMDLFSRVRCIDPISVWRLLDENISLREFYHYRESLVKFKTDNGLLDFTDMLQQYLDYGPTLDIDVAFIDEAQDLSTLQWQVVEKAFSNCDKIFIGGDDDQSIYAWNGADVEYFMNIKGTKQILYKSHRLPKSIYDESQKIIKKVSKRVKKDFSPSGLNGNVEFVEELNYIDFNKCDGDWFLLSRNGYLLRHYEILLKGSGIPYLVSGKKSVLDDHLKAILSWEKLRKGNNVNSDEILNIIKYMRAEKEISKNTKRLISDQPINSNFNMSDLTNSFGLLTDKIWHDALNGISISQREYYLSILRSGRKLTGEFNHYIDTIHGVKGGEADNVVMSLDMAVRTFGGYQINPNSEHRVFYVGATRAKRNLFIVNPSTQLHYSM